MISPTDGGTGTVPGPGAPGPLEPGSGTDPVRHWGKWPLRSYLELAPLPSAVPCARLHARAILWEWSLTAFHDTACLIVSELTTNAIQASAGLTGSRYEGGVDPGDAACAGLALLRPAARHDGGLGRQPAPARPRRARR